MSPEERLHLAASDLEDTLKADAILYNGPTLRPADRRLIDMCQAQRRHEKVFFILVTSGGDPHAAYRLARCLQETYKSITVFVPGYCKSAGTLFALCANELVMSRHAELGPVDIQLRKMDELFEMRSGQTVTQALQVLHGQSYHFFQEYVLQLKDLSKGQISLKTAMQIAGDMTSGLLGQISAQIDPFHLGEAGRAMAIATHYGDRLLRKSGNLSEDSLDRLVVGYPSHSFVIDRAEAKELFNVVREPSEQEQRLADMLGPLALDEYDFEKQIIKYLARNENPQPELKPIQDAGDETKDTSSESVGQEDSAPDERRPTVPSGGAPSTTSVEGATPAEDPEAEQQSRTGSERHPAAAAG